MDSIIRENIIDKRVPSLHPVKFHSFSFCLATFLHSPFPVSSPPCTLQGSEAGRTLTAS